MDKSLAEQIEKNKELSIALLDADFERRKIELFRNRQDYQTCLELSQIQRKMFNAWADRHLPGKIDERCR